MSFVLQSLEILETNQTYTLFSNRESMKTNKLTIWPSYDGKRERTKNLWQ